MSAPLTPEELLSEELHGGHLTRPIRIKIFSAMSRYADQQTAAKDEEIAAQDAEIAKLREELDKCDKERVEVIDIMGKKTIEIKKMDARIKELEEQSAIKHERIIDLENECKALEEIEEGKDARIAELEKERNNWKEEYDLMSKSRDEVRIKSKQRKEECAQLLEKVEQLEKERDDLKKRVLLEVTDMVRVMEEHDQALDMLEVFPNKEGRGNQDWNIRRLTLLSSRENKKPDIIDSDFERGMMEGH